MALICAQVIGRTVDNVPENFITNTFAFQCEPDGTTFDALTEEIRQFYIDLATPLLSGKLANTGWRVKYILIGGPTPNYPIEEQEFGLSTSPGGDSLPEEVALVGSFQGARVAGQPQARRRGRIFIGPLRETVNDNGRPSSTAINALAGALESFGGAVNAISGCTWGVHSRVDGVVTPILDGWVDNSFDTQRRRGVITTARTTYEV